jgi:T-complex protein 1 subunit alpha
VCVCVRCLTLTRSAASVILRGPNTFALDEMERSLHDALSIVKRVLESGACACASRTLSPLTPVPSPGYVVAGGGAVEAALSIYLDDFAKVGVCGPCA